MASIIEREGVVRDEKSGELVIPASQRPDGTWRKARRVRDGYIPQEEVPLFESKGTQFVKSLPTHPIGLSPDDIAKNEHAKKAAEELALHSGNVHTSKAAKKNAKRKEKKRQEQKCTAGGETVDGVLKMMTSVEQINISSAVKEGVVSKVAAGNSQTKTDLEKKLKNLKKKLKQIEDLENKIALGELKTPEKEQLNKMSKKQAVIDEIEDIELQIEDS